jgi:hypothetical protein
MADPLDIFRQRERPGYFVQPTTPPRDIRDLSIAELDSYLRGFSSPPVGNDPTASPYSAQDLRLERARRGTPTRRMDEGFEDARISNPPPTTRARPAAARPSNTNAPAQPPAASRQPATDLDRLRATAALDPNFSDQGSIYGPSLPAGQQQQAQQSGQQLSILDMLRKRVARDAESERVDRLADLGAGMVASGSPNFFTMLAAGTRAQAEGERSRTDRLRQIADLERQDAAQRAEEARRQEELRIRAEEQAANAPLRAAQTQFYLSRADADPAGIATTRAENAARNAASAYAARAVQDEANRRSRAVPPLPALTESEAATIRSNAFRQGMLERGFAPPAGAAAPSVTSVPTPAAVIDARGNVVNPPR